MPSERIVLKWLLVGVLVMLASARFAEEFEEDDDNFHPGDPDFDHDAVAGSHEEAEEYKAMEPEVAKRRLSIIVKRMDTNKDGLITKNELHNYLIKSFKSIDLENAKDALNDLDANKDGKISFDEFVQKSYGYTQAEMEKMKAETSKETKSFLENILEDQEKFTAADLNKDGKLTLDEYPAFMHPHHYKHMQEFEVKHHLKYFDKDKDGTISFVEFAGEGASKPEERRIEQNHFDELDRDKNGKLDKAEVILWIAPGLETSAREEMNHLLEKSDANKDGALTMDEIIDDHETWVSSSATDYGAHLEKLKRDEL